MLIERHEDTLPTPPIELFAPAPVGTEQRPRADAHETVFRRLLGAEAWHRLSPAIRERFARHPSAAQPILYDGAMIEVRRSAIGAALAHLCRLIGTPLAPFAGRNVPIKVKVHDDGTGGVVWQRTYAFPRRRPITVVSTKKADVRAGLVECVGGGFGMTLDIYERDGALHFTSRNYFWQIGSLRVPLPGLLAPGVTHVVHSDLGGGFFRFAMRIVHPLLGETFFQDGVFHETGG